MCLIILCVINLKDVLNFKVDITMWNKNDIIQF